MTGSPSQFDSHAFDFEPTNFFPDNPSPRPDSSRAFEAGASVAADERRSLSKLLQERVLKLFLELTGLELHAFWNDPARPPTEVCPAVRKAAGSKKEIPSTCRLCMEERWRVALRANGVANRFIGLCGMANSCAHVRADGVRLLTLTIQ